MKYLLLLLFSVGCANDLELDQRHAEQIVWRDVFMEKVPPPLVYWRFQESLECGPDAHGQNRGFKPWWNEPEFDCVAGVYLGSYTIVALPDRYKLSDTAYAHELLHAHLFNTKGDGNGKHDWPEWNSLLPMAITLMKEAGL